VKTKDERFILQNCPDKKAYLEVKLSCEKEGEVNDSQM
jgi:hypothetical protein